MEAMHLMGRWKEEEHSACKVFHDAFAWLELGAKSKAGRTQEWMEM